MSDAGIERLGEDALLLRLGDSVDASTNLRVHRLAESIAARRPPWLVDLVPAYASLAVFVDPAHFDAGVDPLVEPGRWLADCAEASAVAGDGGGALIEIPVRYGGEDGPDLDAVAAEAGMSPREAVALHCAGDYRVAMLGFAPGFPYLIGLDPRLATPRLATPRPRVPAGSVGIGGAQTGIYPRSGPGGWRLIGRTDLRLFDATRDPPATLSPGDRVRFVPVGGSR
ncbi:5-oxoprolinase subunit PxpB [Luteimonas vadosa]|uniref:5-oxoprolinase subunit PxpB n=1 Tax=Luteimonas vadosa TaxID=1165507 RepID=A0ABP9DYJ3_9GAMM